MAASFSIRFEFGQEPGWKASPTTFGTGPIIFWNTRRRQKALDGLTPEEFRNQAA